MSQFLLFTNTTRLLLPPPSSPSPSVLNALPSLTSNNYLTAHNVFIYPSIHLSFLPIHFRPTLSCPVLLYSALFCSALLRLSLCCFTLVLPYSILSSPSSVLSCQIPLQTYPQSCSPPWPGSPVAMPKQSSRKASTTPPNRTTWTSSQTPTPPTLRLTST